MTLQISLFCPSLLSTGVSGIQPHTWQKPLSLLLGNARPSISSQYSLTYSSVVWISVAGNSVILYGKIKISHRTKWPYSLLEREVMASPMARLRYMGY